MKEKTATELQQQEDARNSPYIQFPLALLALYAERFELMDIAISYGLMYRARTIYRKSKTDDEFLRQLDRWCPDPEPPDYDDSNRRHKALAAAQAQMGIGASVQVSFARWRDVRSRLDELNVDSEKTVFVRIPIRRAFGLKNEWDGLNENDVRVLLAITSKIGRQNFVIMTRREIAFRVVGAKDKQQWRQFGKPTLLSDTQIARCVKKLAERLGLISRVLGRRGTLNFFSHKLSFRELSEAVQHWHKSKAISLPVLRV